MNGCPRSLAAILAECDSRGVRLSVTADGTLTVVGPKDGMTPDLVELLRARKADVLLVLYADRDYGGINDFSYEWDWLERPVNAVCPCGSMSWRDVPIHEGQSVRRDCAQCGRFIEFPIWYGKQGVVSTND